MAERARGDARNRPWVPWGRVARRGTGRRPAVPPAASGLEEAAQLAATEAVLQLLQRLRLDLADALARHVEGPTDLLQRVVAVHADAEAHAQDPLLARREVGQHLRG